MNNLLVALFLTGVAYFAFCQVRSYNELMWNKYRFRYFALRDELAMLVLRGEISEDSWEYEHIIDAINFHIGAIETMSLVQIGEVLVRFHTSPEEQQQVVFLSKSIDNPRVAAIVERYMTITHEVLARNTRMQFATIKFAIRVLSLFGSDFRPKRSLILNPWEALVVINTNRSVFGEVAAT